MINHSWILLTYNPEDTRNSLSKPSPMSSSKLNNKKWQKAFFHFCSIKKKTQLQSLLFPNYHQSGCGAFTKNRMMIVSECVRKGSRGQEQGVTHSYTSRCIPGSCYIFSFLLEISLWVMCTLCFSSTPKYTPAGMEENLACISIMRVYLQYDWLWEGEGGFEYNIN